MRGIRFSIATHSDILIGEFENTHRIKKCSPCCALCGVWPSQRRKVEFVWYSSVAAALSLGRAGQSGAVQLLTMSLQRIILLLGTEHGGDFVALHRRPPAIAISDSASFQNRLDTFTCIGDTLISVIIVTFVRIFSFCKGTYYCVLSNAHHSTQSHKIPV
jgi:hypothetical protein